MQFDRNIGEWSNNPMPIRAPEPPANPVPEPEKRLAFVLPFIEKEIDQATALLLKSFDLCGQIPRNLFLVPFKGLKFDMVMSAAQQAFQSVGVIHDMEGKVSDWQKGQQMRDASGPNTFFHQTAWFFYLNKKFPIFLWMESDCTPLTNDWWSQLEREYISMNKPFMGAKMRMPDGKEYMNGVGIYPWNAIQFEPLLVQSTRWKQFPDIEAAFDVAGGQKILDHAHITRKIQLGLGKKKDFKITPEAVLVHGGMNLSGGEKQPCKHGSEDEKDGLNTGIVQPDNSPPTTQQTLSGKQNTEASVSPSKGREEPLPPAQTTLGGDEPRSTKLTANVGCVSKTEVLTSNAAPTVQSSGAAECEHVWDICTGPPTSPHIGEYICINCGEPKVIKNGAPSQSKQDGSEYGSLVKQIRKSVQSLVDLNISPSRKVLIVKELRRAKLVPKHFR